MSAFNTAAVPLALCLTLAACSHGAASMSEPAQAPAQTADTRTAAPVDAAVDTATMKAKDIEIARMKPARQIGKQGAPVDVRYQISGVTAKNQSSALQLAFIPRVDGSSLRVEFPRSESVSVSETTELTQQKAQAANAVRHQLLVTPLKGDTGEVRALVSMDVDGGRYFGIFVIPVGADQR